MSGWNLVAKALSGLACGHGEIVFAAEIPWRSVTFSGHRHTVSLQFNGAEALPYAEALIELLPEYEFALAGKPVGDAEIVSVERVGPPDLRTTVVLTMLVLDYD